MTIDSHNGSRGFGAILRDLSQSGVALVRSELRLARLEIGDVVAGIGRGTGLVATGAVLLLLGTLSVVAGLVLLVGDQWLAADRYWLAALIVMLVAGALAAVLAKRGLQLVSPSHLAPRETVETLKEDQEWVKQQLTSGATSR
jgi:uncharacterized membrane protein YqjE